MGAHEMEQANGTQGRAAPLATKLTDDLWLLDTFFQGEPGVIGSYLLDGAAGVSLVDVGSAATVDTLLDAIRAAGFEPEAVTQIILTHIHLDHAGAAGPLLRRMPRARVLVHRLGAPHLIDPSKLIASAQRIYGERMATLWGAMEAIPAERLDILDDGARVRVGGRELEALYTPGHATHHLAYHDAERRAVFSGDVAGVRLQRFGMVRPPTPPPDLVLEDWYASIERIAALDPATLYLPHYGPSTNMADHFAQLRQRLADWGETLLPGIRAGASDAELAATLAAHADVDVRRAAAAVGGGEADAVRLYELSANYLMSAQGYVRYYRKHRPELLA